MSKKKLKGAWNLVADDYQKIHKISPNYIHYGPWLPTENELKLIGDVTWKHVLEVGCGGGHCSIAFAKRGAVVTGIDLSESQIEFAKKLAAREKVKVKFLVGDAENLRSVKSNSMDIAFSAYAFQYLRNLRKCFREIKRVLKKNGILVFSLNHPFSEVFDFGTLKVRRSYYKKGLDYFQWCIEGKKSKKFYVVKRTLEGVFTDLVEAGFVVERILEPAPLNKDKSWDWSMDYPLKILKMIPYTIIFKCRKKYRIYR